MRNIFRGETALLLRNLVFGIEDSLVSTVGLLSGIAVTGSSSALILLTGTILIFVEAFSMAVGSFLSEDSVQIYVEHHKNSYVAPLVGGVVMFMSYFISGFIPLLPYVFFRTGDAFLVSIFSALTALFLLGAISAKMFGIHFVRQGIKMLIMGGIAILVGVLAGKFAEYWYF